MAGIFHFRFLCEKSQKSFFILKFFCKICMLVTAGIAVPKVIGSNSGGGRQTFHLKACANSLTLILTAVFWPPITHGLEGRFEGLSPAHFTPFPIMMVSELCNSARGGGEEAARSSASFKFSHQKTASTKTL